MERSRFVTVALLIISFVTVAHLGISQNLSFSAFLVLLLTASCVHIVSYACSKFKFLHAISPLVSFFVLLAILVVVNAQGTTDTSTFSVFDLYESIRSGVEELKSNTLQVEPYLVLVYILLTWCVAEIGETLAQRLHSSAPTITWYVLINSLIFSMTGHFNFLIVVGLCGSFWFYLYAFNWTHEHSKAHKIEIPSASRITNYLGYALSFILIVTLSMSLAIPDMNLPSLAPKNLFEFLNPSPPKAELSPFVGLRDLLNSPSDDVLFTATSSQSQYFRVQVLDVLTEDTWRQGDEEIATPEPLLEGVEGTKVQATIKLEDLSNSYLPVFYSVNEITAENVEFLKHSVVSNNDSNLQEYSFSANVPPSTLNPEQIALSSDYPPSSVQSSLLIPTTFDEDIIRQARTIASNRDSIYAQAIALRDFFLDGSFEYDINVDYTSDVNAMKTFLSERRGYCEQFAATYAAMARSIGIPARVVIGFSPGDADEHGNFVITSHQAHAWVEVYLSNFGWLTIDPTPPGDLPGQAPENIGQAFNTTTTTTTTTVPTTQTSQVAPSTSVPRDEFEYANESGDSNVWPLAIVLILLLSMGALGFFARRHYWKQDKNIANYVRNTFEEIGRKILDTDPDPSMTVKELSELVPDKYSDINQFLDLLEEVSYSPNKEIDLSELKHAATRARAEKISS